MKNFKKFLPNPVVLVLGMFTLCVMIATWGGSCPYDVFCSLGSAAAPVFLGLLIGGMLLGMYLLMRFVMWYEDWRER